MSPDQTTIETALTAVGITGTALAAVKALSQPWFLKITDVLERAGVAYLAPRQLKRLAVAKAEVQIIEAHAKAEADRIALEAQFRLEDRAIERTAATIHREQQNLDRISVLATMKIVEDLKGTPDLEPPLESIEEDWFAAFFGFAKHISSEAMQELWASLLAGEVRAPGAFSYRTINIVSQLRKREAEEFAQLAACAWTVRRSPSREIPVVFMGSQAREYLSRKGLWPDGINGLEELGLVKVDGYHLEMKAQQTFDCSFGSDRYHLTSKALTPKQVHELEARDYNNWTTAQSKAPYLVNAISFTRSGEELLTVCQAKPDQGYLRAMQRDFGRNDIDIRIGTPKDVSDNK